MAQPPIRGRASPSSKQEVERIEQQRLAQPCMRNIDLRSVSGSKCKEFRHAGRVHWLDEYGQAVFEVMINKYRGQYTLGVYEKVVNTRPEKTIDPKDEQKREASGINELSVLTVDFGYRPRRAESRLNYVSTLTIELENGNKIQGKTLDLSLLGVRVQPLSQVELAPGTPLLISFDDLQQKNPEPLGEIAYIVVSTDKEPDRWVYRLKRQMRDSEEEFNQFIPHFIESQSSRYKHELKDLVPVVYARAYDRLYGQRMQCLYAYFRPTQERLELDLAVGPIEYALIEETPLIALASRQIPRIFSAKQLGQISEQSYNSDQSLHAIRWQSHVFVIPAEAFTNEQCKADWLRLWNEAEERQSYAVLWRKQAPLHPADSEETLEMLPESLLDHGNVWREHLRKIQFSCALVPIASLIRPSQIFEALPTQIPDWLKTWEVTRTAFPLLVGMGVRAQRVQDRYNYKTPIQIEGDKETVTGEVLDFSVNGLKIELHSRCSFVGKEVVRVSFPALKEKIKDPEQLSQQSYKVVRVMHGGLFVTLERDFRVYQHGAARFLTQIIQNNRHRLPRCTYEQQQIADARLAELLVGNGLNGVPFFVARDEEKKPSVLVFGHNPAHSLLTTPPPHPISVTTLNQREFLLPLLAEQCNNVGVVDKIRHCLVTMLPGGENGAIWTIVHDQLLPKQTLQLKEAIAQDGRVFACSLAPVNALPRRELEILLRPVFNNSRYKADQIRIELNRIVGIGSLFDVTNAIRKELMLVGA